MRKLLLWAVCLLPLLVACRRPAVSGEQLQGTQLFSLDIGVLEDEVDFFYRGSVLPIGKNSIFMHQGIIFMGNSLGSKVMEFSSYGDLISLIYNESENPRPVLLSSRFKGEKTINKSALAFPFRNVGDIAVSSDRILLVGDIVSDERQLFDQKTGALLQHIVQRFAPDGSHLDYIGQEGIGGTPFPFIISLEVTARDDLVVITRNRDAHNVFWYDRHGKALFTVAIDTAHLPAGKNPEDFPRLVGVFPDRKLYRLYLHINFETSEPDVIDSQVYLLDFPEGRYTGSFDLVQNLQALLGDEGIEYVQYPYQFIGTAENEHLFFISRNNNREHSFVVFDSAGNLKVRRTLRMENPEVFLSDYHVSSEGIITALLGDSDSVDVYWWRVDSLLKGAQNVPFGLPVNEGG